MSQHKLKKILFLCLGVLFTIIGVIGIFLPLLPTTIFLIIASYFFLNSSPKSNKWLEGHKILGTYIKAYRKKTGIPLKSKVSSIIILWISIIFSAFLLENIYVRFLLFLIAIAVSIHIYRIKTLRLEAISKIEEEQF